MDLSQLLDDIPDWVAIILMVLSSGGGLAGYASFLKGRSESKKNRAEARKTDAETEDIRIQGWIATVESNQTTIDKHEKRLEKYEERLERYDKELEECITARDTFAKELDILKDQVNGYHNGESYGGTK